MKWIRACGLAVVLGVGLIVEAAAQGTNQTVITAKRLTFDYKRFIAVFEDEVVVEDPKVRIESDQMTVIFHRTNDVKSVTATGNVRMKSQDKVATCKKAVYLADTEEVLLTGDAVLSRGRDRVSGDRITFYLNQERVICEPGRLVIFPQEGGGGWKP